MRWNEVQELGPLYALGALDRETAQGIEDYLQGATPEQQLEIKSWHELVGFLPLALPSARVPESLRKGLLHRISEDPRSTSATVDETRAQRPAGNIFQHVMI